MPDNNIPLNFVNPELEFNLELDTNNRINKLQSELNLPEYKLNFGDVNTQYFPEFQPKFDFEKNEVVEGKKLFDAQFSSNPIEAAKARELMNKKFEQDFNIKNDLRTPTLTSIEQTKRYTSEDQGFVPFTNNEDFYHSLNWDSKGLFNKVGTMTKNIVGRVATGAVLKFGEGFGYIGSMLGNIGQDDYWGKVADNGFSKFLEGLEESSKQTLFKVYKSANYDNKGFISKMGDATFWQDEAADGLAFMASSMIPMGVLGKLGQAAKFGRLAILAADLPSTTMVGRAIGVGLEFTTGSKNILGIAGHVYSVASEAAFEAVDTYKQTKESLIKQGYTNQEASKIAGEKASQTYIGNVGVLTFSNAFENKMMQKMLNRGIDGQAKHALNFADDLSVNAEKATTKWGKFFSENTWGERLKFYGKQAGKQAGKGFIAEGLWEENAQLAIQRIASGEYEARERGTGKVTTKKAGNFIEQLFTNTKDALLGNDLEAETSIGIGALIGVGGGVISSKISGERKRDKSEKLQTIANLTETRNNWLKNNIYETNEDGSLKLDENKKLVIDPAKVAVRDQKIAEMTSKLNMAKELQNTPELKAFVERSAFTDFALAHIKNDSIDYLIDKLENWNTKDKETLAAYGFSQEQQQDISPKKFAEIAKDLKYIYNESQDTKFDKPENISIKDAINLAYLAKEGIFKQKAYIYHIESILNDGFQQFENEKFREYKTLIQERDNIDRLLSSEYMKTENSGIKEGYEISKKEITTKINSYESNNKDLVNEYNKLDKTKKELERTLNGEIVNGKKVDGFKDILAKLSNKETGLVYTNTNYSKKIEQAEKEEQNLVKTKESVKNTSDNKVDVIAKFFEKNTKVKSLQDLKDKLNVYYKEKGDDYPIEEVRKKLLSLYKEASEVADNEDLSTEQKKSFEELINSLIEIGKKNNTLNKVQTLSQKDIDKLKAAIKIVNEYNTYVARKHSMSKDFLSKVPPYIKNLSKAELALLVKDLNSKLSNKSYVFTEEDYKSVFGTVPKKENLQNTSGNTSIITDPNLITKIKDVAKNILSYNGMVQQNLKPSEEFLKNIPEHIKNLSIEDSKKINLIIYDILFKNKPITTENAELILGISLSTPNNKSNVPKNAIITDIQRQYKIVKPTALVEVLEYLTEEEVANDLTIELVENALPAESILEKESNESYKVTLSNPSALGEKWIAIKYKGELVGYLNSPDVFTYNTPRGIVKAEDLTKEEFEAITKNLNEYDKFINDARQYRILHNSLVKQQVGSVKDLLKLLISPGQYDYAENDQESLSLEGLYEKYPNMVIFNRTTRTQDGKVIYNTIDPETPLLTAEQDIEAEAFIKTLNKSSRYGRFVAAILLPNGKFKAIQLKAPKFTDEQLDIYFDSLKTTLAEIDVLSQGEVLQAEDREAREEIRNKFNESLTPFVAIDPASKPSTSYVDIEFNISFPEKGKSKSPVFQVSVETLGDKTKNKNVFIPIKEIEGKTTDEIIAVINTALANVGQKIVLTRSSFLYPVKTDVSFNKALEQLKTNVKLNVFKNPTVKIKIENPQVFTPEILKKADEVSKEPEPEVIDPIEAIKAELFKVQTEINEKLNIRNNDKVIRQAINDSNKSQKLEPLDAAFKKWDDENGLTDLILKHDKLNAELKALEQQSTSTTQSEIEAKKADIEKRRPTSYIKDSKDKKSSLETFRNGAKREWDGVSVITGDRMKNLYVGIQLFVEAYQEHKELLDKFIKKENGTIGITNNNLSFVLNTLKKQGITTESELGGKINAKYDAELKALEGRQTQLNIVKVYHHTSVAPQNFDFSNFQRGKNQISQFGDGLNAATTTNDFFVSRYGNPIEGEVKDSDFIVIDANKSEKELYEELRSKGYKFNNPATGSYIGNNPAIEYNSEEKANEQPAIIFLFNDFQKSNPQVKGVKIINHIIGNQKVNPFYVIYDAKSFYGLGSLSKKSTQAPVSDKKADTTQSEPTALRDVESTAKALDAKKADIERRRQEANNKNEEFWEQFTAINAEEVADRDNLINKLIKDISLPANTRINNWVLEELNGKLWKGKNIRGKEEEFFGKENWDKIKEAKKQFDIEFKKIEDSNLAKIKLIEQKQSALLSTVDGVELRRAWSLGLIEEPNIVGLDETNFISKETDNYEGYYYLSKPDKDGEWYEQIIGKTEKEVENEINAKYDAELKALEQPTSTTQPEITEELTEEVLNETDTIINQQESIEEQEEFIDEDETVEDIEFDVTEEDLPTYDYDIIASYKKEDLLAIETPAKTTGQAALKEGNKDVIIKVKGLIDIKNEYPLKVLTDNKYDQNINVFLQELSNNILYQTNLKNGSWKLVLTKDTKKWHTLRGIEEGLDLGMVMVLKDSDNNLIEFEDVQIDQEGPIIFTVNEAAFDEQIDTRATYKANRDKTSKEDVLAFYEQTKNDLKILRDNIINDKIKEIEVNYNSVSNGIKTYNLKRVVGKKEPQIQPFKIIDIIKPNEFDININIKEGDESLSLGVPYIKMDNDNSLLPVGTVKLSQTKLTESLTALNYIQDLLNKTYENKEDIQEAHDMINTLVYLKDFIFKIGFENDNYYFKVSNKESNEEVSLDILEKDLNNKYLNISKKKLESGFKLIINDKVLDYSTLIKSNLTSIQLPIIKDINNPQDSLSFQGINGYINFELPQNILSLEKTEIIDNMEKPKKKRKSKAELAKESLKDLGKSNVILDINISSNKNEDITTECE